MNNHAKVLRDMSEAQGPLTAVILKDAAKEIERLERECEIDQRNAAASQKESAELLDKLDEAVCGKIHEANSMFLRNDCGSAADPETGKDVYEMSSGMGGTPIIRSIKTGKWFTLSWIDIIGMAERKGINS